MNLSRIQTKNKKKLKLYGSYIKSINMTIPPKWFYNESSISKNYISGKAEYYYNQSETTWPQIELAYNKSIISNISNGTVKSLIETIKDQEFKKQFGKTTQELSAFVQNMAVNPDYTAKVNINETMINSLFSLNSNKTAQIKKIYLGKKGIWLVEKDKNGKTIDAAQPIPVTQDNKYQLLWETSAKEYKVKIIQQLINTVNVDKLLILSESLQKLLFLKDGKPDTERITAYKKNPIYYTRTLNPAWPLKSLYIDTINYNEFEKELKELQALYSRFSKLPPKEQKVNDKKINPETGKEYKPICDKYFPFDYGKLFGMRRINVVYSIYES